MDARERRRKEFLELLSTCDWDNLPTQQIADEMERIVSAAESDARREERAKVQRLCEMVEALLGRDDFWKRPDLVGFVPGELDDVADALQALKGKP